MKSLDQEEYYFLREKLELVEEGLRGFCDDVDCDKYGYKDLLKIKYKPVLEHNFSYISKLKKEKQTLLRLLSKKSFQKYRYKKCNICKERLDELGKEYNIVGFTKLLKEKKVYQYESVCVHKKCSQKVKTPQGWEKLN